MGCIASNTTRSNETKDRQESTTTTTIAASNEQMVEQDTLLSTNVVNTVNEIETQETTEKNDTKEENDSKIYSEQKDIVLTDSKETSNDKSKLIAYGVKKSFMPVKHVHVQTKINLQRYDLELHEVAIDGTEDTSKMWDDISATQDRLSAAWNTSYTNDRTLSKHKADIIELRDQLDKIQKTLHS